MRLPSLYQFFRHQLQQGFHAHGLSNSASTVDYVSDILARFAQTRALYAVQNSEGRPIEHIVDLLVEWQEARGQYGRTGSKERRILRHIGEYTLFMTGLFRDRVTARGELNYYLAHGANAFWRSADFEPNPARCQVYRYLYKDFNPISDILNHFRGIQIPTSSEDRAKGNLFAAYWRT